MTKCKCRRRVAVLLQTYDHAFKSEHNKLYELVLPSKQPSIQIITASQLSCGNRYSFKFDVPLTSYLMGFLVELSRLPGRYDGPAWVEAVLLTQITGARKLKYFETILPRDYGNLI